MAVGYMGKPEVDPKVLERSTKKAVRGMRRDGQVIRVGGVTRKPGGHGQ
jgi:hypothetical protein